MDRLKRWLSGIAPLAIIAGLLYAGLFVKPPPPAIDLTAAVLGPRDAYYGIAVPEAAVLWAVGRDGKVVRSDDAGAHWVQQAVPAPVNLQSIAAWDAQHAVAVGNGGTVLFTVDGGKQWRAGSGYTPANESQKLIRVRVVSRSGSLSGSSTQAYAVGEFGAVLATNDRGATWRSIGSAEDVAWHDIAALADGSLLVVGEFGRMQRSTDGGATWSAVASPVKSTLTALRFADADAKHGIAVGLEGVLLSTSDGGLGWQRLQSPTKEHLFDVAPAAGGAAAGWLAVGDKGLLLRGAPDGSWTAARIDDASYAWHMQIVPAGDGRLYLAGAQLARVEADRKLTVFR